MDPCDASGDRPGGQGDDRSPLEEHRSGEASAEPAEAAQQAALARSVGSDDRQEISPADQKAEPVQDTSASQRQIEAAGLEKRRIHWKIHSEGFVNNNEFEEA